MGGNALLRWTQEMGGQAAPVAHGVAAICSPIDLAAGGHAIGQGFNRLVYTRMFLNTMKPKALRKLQQHPGLFDRDTLLAARDLHAFDNVFTAPLHGFRNTEDYWARASAQTPSFCDPHRGPGGSCPQRPFCAGSQPSACAGCRVACDALAA
jgi:predicted alpha/beta-fold hydrolase